MRNFYEVLGVARDSSYTDVKSSFRRKAKQLHPDIKAADTNRAEVSVSDDDMKLLLQAYQVLSNPQKREAYDKIAFRFKATIESNYREFLRRRESDLVCQSKLILYDLLHANTIDALELYEKLAANHHFRLDLYLNWEDYMDCTFLLAEQFDLEGDHLKAFELFKKLYLEELRRPYFKHFIDEVVDRIKRIACFSLLQMLPPDRSINCLKELLAFELPRKDKATLYKRIAEIYSEMGQNQRAVEYLHRGLKFNKKLAGIKKLKEKIGYSEIIAS